VSRSAGTGSPVAFRCHVERSTLRRGGEHRVKLTGRVRPYEPRGPMGSRSTFVAREYECSCGHVGWSNHIDLAHYAHPEMNHHDLSYRLIVKDGKEVFRDEVER
jgi:hypothetical protein